MSYKRINITIPAELLSQLDHAKCVDYHTRSAFIREAILLKLHFDSNVEHLSDRDSLFSTLHSYHGSRMIKRRIRKNGPLSYTDAQE